MRAFRGEFPHAPDAVARPRDEAELAARARVVRRRAASRSIAATAAARAWSAASIRCRARRTRARSRSTCRALDRVLEVDPVSRAARIQAGASGPRLEEQLARARADAALLPAVVRALDARRLDRHARGRPLRDGARRTSTTSSSRCARSRPAARSGSRGGCPARAPGRRRTGCCSARRGRSRVITEAWVRVRARPPSRRSARRGVPVASRPGARRCARSCRPGCSPRTAGWSTRARRALTFAATARGAAGARLRGRRSSRSTRAAALCRAHGGRGARGGGGGARRVARGVPARAVPARHVRGDGRAERDVRDRDHLGAAAGLRRVRARRGRARRSAAPAIVTCRLTHAYPDGAAPYFTVLAPAGGGPEAALARRSRRSRRRGDPRGGGTITHHHAVGRDHRDAWYDAQRPEPFAAALRAARRRRSTRPASSIRGYSSRREHRRVRQEHAGRLQGQGAPRQVLPLGRQGATRCTSPGSTSSAWAGRRAT